MSMPITHRHPSKWLLFSKGRSHSVSNFAFRAGCWRGSLLVPHHIELIQFWMVLNIHTLWARATLSRLYLGQRGGVPTCVKIDWEVPQLWRSNENFPPKICWTAENGWTRWTPSFISYLHFFSAWACPHFSLCWVIAHIWSCGFIFKTPRVVARTGSSACRTSGWCWDGTWCDHPIAHHLGFDRSREIHFKILLLKRTLCKRKAGLKANNVLVDCLKILRLILGLKNQLQHYLQLLPSHYTDAYLSTNNLGGLSSHSSPNKDREKPKKSWEYWQNPGKKPQSWFNSWGHVIGDFTGLLCGEVRPAEGGAKGEPRWLPRPRGCR